MMKYSKALDCVLAAIVMERKGDHVKAAKLFAAAARSKSILPVFALLEGANTKALKAQQASNNPAAVIAATLTNIAAKRKQVRAGKLPPALKKNAEKMKKGEPLTSGEDMEDEDMEAEKEEAARRIRAKASSKKRRVTALSEEDLEMEGEPMPSNAPVVEDVDLEGLDPEMETSSEEFDDIDLDNLEIDDPANEGHPTDEGLGGEVVNSGMEDEDEEDLEEEEETAENQEEPEDEDGEDGGEGPDDGIKNDGEAEVSGAEEEEDEDEDNAKEMAKASQRIVRRTAANLAALQSVAGKRSK